MKFSTDRPVKVVMLGAGGTGGYVAPHVFRLLHMLDRPARFVVCDGDIVEPKNLDRQNFAPADLGENKARVLAERYSTVLGMETEYVPNFIEKLPDLMELIEPKEWELNPYSTKRTKEMVLLLGCVDNNKTRQLCHQAFHQSEELIYIDSGNGKYTGQVVCGVRRNGRTIRRSIGGVHPEMLKDTDLFPSEISCAEAAQEDPQSMSKYVLKLLESYNERERKIAVLRYNLEHPTTVSRAEQIEAMNFRHDDSLGHSAGHISNKTLYIALNYEEQAERMNAESAHEIAKELFALECEQRRLTYFIGLLDKRQAEVIRLVFVDGIPTKEVAASFGLTYRTIDRIKRTAIENLVEMYAYSDQFQV